MKCVCNLAVDVAVVDEIQMVRDLQRGWAWTRVVLGELAIITAPTKVYTLVNKIIRNVMLIE